MINDPLIYKLKDDLWRVCIADSDVLLFAKGIAAGKNLKVDTVSFDSYSGGYMIAKHFEEVGYSEMGIISTVLLTSDLF